MKVLVSSHLHGYTGGRSQLEASGRTLAEVLLDLEARHPGMRFRVVDEQDQIREHIRFFVNGERATSLSQLVGTNDEVHIIGALSGG